MKKFLFIPFAALTLIAGCSKEESCENPEPEPNPGPEPVPVSVWDGKSVTEPFDINPTDKTATIMLASDLAWLSEQSNASGENTFEGWTFTLGRNLDLAGKQWTAIAQWSQKNNVIFKGSFDGNGHSIVGLYVDNPGEVNSGLFGVTQGSVIKDLQVEGTVRGNRQVGGICANAQKGTRIENCQYAGKVECRKDKDYTAVGGICGRAETTMRVMNCHSSATIVYGAEELELDAGGIVGVVIETSGLFVIRNCSFSGTFEKGFDVKGPAYVGGIVGRMATSDLSACKNTADITIEGNGRIYLGGIVGAAQTKSSTVRACYNTGAITNNSTAEGQTGGIVGSLDNTCYISAAYNTGVITPSSGESSAEEKNQEINRWKYGNSLLLDCFYKADKPEAAGVKRFTADQWPNQARASSWIIGNDPAAGKFWKSMGSPATEDYPTLWWE